MIEPQMSRMRTYAWNYFAFHADQRLKTFNFYLIAVGIFVAGLLNYLAKSESAESRLPSLFCFAITFVSLAFWRLDRRNSYMIKNAERALTYLDSEETHSKEAEVLALFAQDDLVSKVNPRKWHISYSKVFTLIFCFFGLISALWGIHLWP